jgi:hypothetical protein
MSDTRRQSGRETEQTLSPARQPGASKILDRLDQLKLLLLNRKLTQRSRTEDDDVFEESEDDGGAESDASEYGASFLSKYLCSKSSHFSSQTFFETTEDNEEIDCCKKVCTQKISC